MPSLPIFTGATTLACLAVGSALANPHVRILQDMSGEVLAASRDGNVLASSRYYQFGGGGNGLPFFAPATAWRRDTGATIGNSGPIVAIPNAVSADGAVVAGAGFGYSDRTSDGPFAWIVGAPGAPLIHLRSPAGTYARGAVTWLSPDGSTALGQSNDGYAARWSDLLGPGAPVAVYLHRDGSTSAAVPSSPLAIMCTQIIAGELAARAFVNDFSETPYTWTGTHGYLPLPLQATWLKANVRAVSSDGGTAVGTAFAAGATYLVRWTVDPVTQAATAQALAGPFPSSPEVSAASIRPMASMTSDASIIAYNPVAVDDAPSPILWFASGSLGTPDLTGAGRVVPFTDYLAAHGVLLNSIEESADGHLVITELVSISADARTFAGNGVIQIDDPDFGVIDKQVVWTIRLPACNAADLAGLGGSPAPDGQLTADDVVVYLTAFFAGDLAAADLVHLGGAPGPDGQITPDDLIAFLAAFFAGCL